MAPPEELGSGTYLVSNLTFATAPTAAPGVYMIGNTTAATPNGAGVKTTMLQGIFAQDDASGRYYFLVEKVELGTHRVSLRIQMDRENSAALSRRWAPSRR